LPLIAGSDGTMAEVPPGAEGGDPLAGGGCEVTTGVCDVTDKGAEREVAGCEVTTGGVDAGVTE